jgi:hypothetical protein
MREEEEEGEEEERAVHIEEGATCYGRQHP